MTAWDKSRSSLLRSLPSITAILQTAAAAELVQRFGHKASTEAIRATVACAREAMKAGIDLKELDAEGRRIIEDNLGRLHFDVSREVITRRMEKDKLWK